MSNSTNQGVGTDNQQAHALENALHGGNNTTTACQAVQKTQIQNPYLEAIAEEEHPTHHTHAPEDYYEFLAAIEQGENGYS